MRFIDFCENKTNSGFSIFVDMDGVLVEFDDGVRRFMNDPSFSFENKTNRNEFWKRVSNLDPKEAIEFWASLDWAPGGQQLWKYISKFNASILSSPGNQLRDVIEAGKWEWIRRNMRPQPKKVIFEPEKWKHAGRFNILIDDTPKKYEAWENHGGIAIPYKAGRDNHMSVIKELQDRFKFSRR